MISSGNNCKSCLLLLNLPLSVVVVLFFLAISVINMLSYFIETTVSSVGSYNGDIDDKQTTVVNNVIL